MGILLGVAPLLGDGQCLVFGVYTSLYYALRSNDLSEAEPQSHAFLRSA